MTEVQSIGSEWMSVTDLARIRGVSQQAVSKRLKHLGQAVPTRIDGRKVLVHAPSFDAITRQTHDPAQDLRNRRLKGMPADDEADLFDETVAAPNFNVAAAREKLAKAEIAENRLAIQRGELVQAREIEKAAVECGTSIAQAIASIKASSGKLYAAAKGGEDALHIELVGVVNKALETVGEAMAKLASRVPDQG